jgi:transcriptional regulator with XRE-family HTH domain
MSTKKSETMKFLDALIGEPISIGGLLTAIRESDELSQSDLAKRLGISKSHLCDLEKGRKVLSPERAARFARELGYSEEQFVRLALQHMVESAGLAFFVGLTEKPIRRSSRRPGARPSRPRKAA